MASDGLGWPRMASDDLGWPRMASDGLGLPRFCLCLPLIASVASLGRFHETDARALWNPDGGGSDERAERAEGPYAVETLVQARHPPRREETAASCAHQQHWKQCTANPSPCCHAADGKCRGARRSAGRSAGRSADRSGRRCLRKCDMNLKCFRTSTFTACNYGSTVHSAVECSGVDRDVRVRVECTGESVRECRVSLCSYARKPP